MGGKLKKRGTILYSEEKYQQHIFGLHPCYWAKLK